MPQTQTTPAPPAEIPPGDITEHVLSGKVGSHLAVPNPGQPVDAPEVEYRQGRLTREGMLRILQSGRTVSLNGFCINHVSLVPATQAKLDELYATLDEAQNVMYQRLKNSSADERQKMVEMLQSALKDNTENIFRLFREQQQKTARN